MSAPKELASNVVEVEFFFIDPSNLSLKEFSSQAVNRLEDGAHLQKTIRFYDTHSLISQLVVKYNEENNRHAQLLDKILAVGFWRRKIICWQAGKKLEACVQIRERLHRLIVFQLMTAIRISPVIAIESNTGRSFRMIEGNELYELATSVEKSVRCWVFVFPPNDTLLFDGIEMLGSVM